MPEKFVQAGYRSALRGFAPDSGREIRTEVEERACPVHMKGMAVTCGLRASNVSVQVIADHYKLPRWQIEQARTFRKNFRVGLLPVQFRRQHQHIYLRH